MLDRVSPHFLRSEFACQCGKCEFSIHPPVDTELLIVLEDLRTFFMQPVQITSGLRCRDHNKAVGGAVNSKHLSGIAADIKVLGVRSRKVYEHLISKYPDKYGIGLYDSWVHIDVRHECARWGA